MTETFENYELIAQGAEARLYKGTYLNRPVLIKHRFVKKYRHESLDKSLASHQIKSEARALARATAAGNYLQLKLLSFYESFIHKKEQFLIVQNYS